MKYDTLDTYIFHNSKFISINSIIGRNCGDNMWYIRYRELVDDSSYIFEANIDCANQKYSNKKIVGTYDFIDNKITEIRKETGESACFSIKKIKVQTKEREIWNEVLR